MKEIWGKYFQDRVVHVDSVVLAKKENKEVLPINKGEIVEKDNNSYKEIYFKVQIATDIVRLTSEKLNDRYKVKESVLLIYGK